MKWPSQSGTDLFTMEHIKAAMGDLLKTLMGFEMKWDILHISKSMKSTHSNGVFYDIIIL